MTALSSTSANYIDNTKKADQAQRERNDSISGSLKLTESLAVKLEQQILV
jgi:hypothetical protein